MRINIIMNHITRCLLCRVLHFKIITLEYWNKHIVLLEYRTVNFSSKMCMYLKCRKCFVRLFSIAVGECR